MGDKRDLKIIIRRKGYKYAEVRISADPRDHSTLRGAVAGEMARQGWRMSDHRTDFTARVEYLDNPDRYFDLAV